MGRGRATFLSEPKVDSSENLPALPKMLNIVEIRVGMWGWGVEVGEVLLL